MSNHVYVENINIYLELKRNTKIKEGDIIEIIPNNQQGYIKYKVLSNEVGEKKLEIIDSYELQIIRMIEE